MGLIFELGWGTPHLKQTICVQYMVCIVHCIYKRRVQPLTIVIATPYNVTKNEMEVSLASHIDHLWVLDLQFTGKCPKN